VGYCVILKRRYLLKEYVSKPIERKCDSKGLFDHHKVAAL